MLDTRHFDTARYLSRLPFFSAIDPGALARLATGCELRRFQRGDMVFRVGEPCDAFHVVAVGQVKLFGLSPAGAEKVVELVGPGQSFAEAVMFLNKPCPVNAQALADSLLLTVHRATVLDELADTGFALCMLAGLSRRLHGLVHDVQAYALQSGVQRVIGYLLNERGAHPDTEVSTTVSLPVSKATVASRLSLTPEYFSRVLRELEEAQLIEVDRRDIRILDVQRLAAYPG